jgi:hypothetical protein
MTLCAALVMHKIRRRMESTAADEAMIQITEQAEARLVEFVRSWFALLARGEWTAALAAIDEPNVHGTRWTEDGLLAVLADTFNPGTPRGKAPASAVFSDPATATGTAHHSFGSLDPGGFWLDHDVPVDGAYSELTAQFEFHARPDGFSVQLHDLHVLQ